jgi:hypothetical protein
VNTQKLARHLRIHGDNIVECERAVSLICDAIGSEAKISGPDNSLTCPEYTISAPSFSIRFELFPGFRRWNRDILEVVTLNGGMLREAADIVITEVIDKKREVAIMAIEFCAALPAGNQAWQRNGRAYSFGSAGIPFFFLADLGGYELGEDRARKAERTPNPAVPFSYISFGVQSKRAVAPVYDVNIGASPETQERFAAINGYPDFHQYLLAALQGQADAAQAALEKLHQKALQAVNILAVSTRDGKISSAEWKAIYNEIKAGRSVSDYLLKRDRIPWSKTAYINDLTSTFLRLVETGSKYATGLTASKLPACLIAPNDRPAFAAAVCAIHEKLTPNFVTWLKGTTKPLAICWVMGFKPRGDDARPDRGLPPFVRMLVGPTTEILTIVYGPLSGGHWKLLRDDPLALQSNGLWQSIMACSDGLLVDAKDRTNRHRDTVLAYPSTHWLSKIAPAAATSILVHPTPKEFGENDVDTALHLVLARIGGDLFFEGSCNPPGGDWSGVSVIAPGQEKILRYLTLPRVSQTEAKRPDHVFQYRGDTSTLIVIESKDTLSKVEDEIGPRLKRYLTDLFKVPSSVEYSRADRVWSHSSSKLETTFNFITVAAGLFHGKSNALADLARTQTDLVIGVEFKETSNKVTFHVGARTKAASTLVDSLVKIASRVKLIEVNVLQKA